MKASNVDGQETKDYTGGEVSTGHTETKWIEVIKNNAHPPILETETAEQEYQRYSNLIDAFTQLGKIYINKAEEYIDLSQTQTIIKHYIDAAKFFNYAISIAKDKEITEEAFALDKIEYLNIKLIKTIDTSNLVAKSAIENTKIDKFEIMLLRDYARSEVEQIEGLSDIEKIERTGMLFKNIAERMQAFLARLYQESEYILGIPPCTYSVIGLGSMALQTMTPYSDLEFAILTKNDDYRGLYEIKLSSPSNVIKKNIVYLYLDDNCKYLYYSMNDNRNIELIGIEFEGIKKKLKRNLVGIKKPIMPQDKQLIFAEISKNKRIEYDDLKNDKTRNYFKYLTQLVHFRIINLLETPIESSKMSYSLDHLINIGVNFDLGGKTPLGREDKPYELIQTVDGMLHYLINEYVGGEHRDKNLPYILEATSYVCGNKRLYDNYKSEVELFLFKDKNYEIRALKRLQDGVIEYRYSGSIIDQVKMIGDLESFEPKLHGNSREGKLFEVKQEIYRLTDRLLYGLTLLYGIPFKNPWDAIDKLETKRIINNNAQNNLKFAVSYATILRLKVYQWYGGQIDDILIPQYKNTVDQEEQTNIMFSFSRNELEISGGLFKYYYTSLPLFQKLEDLCEKYKALNEIEKYNFFQNNPLYDYGIANKGFIYNRLAKYDFAELYLWYAYKKKNYGIYEEQEIVFYLGRIYRKMSTIDFALELYNESLSLSEIIDSQLHKINREYTIFAIRSIIDYGNCCYVIEKNKEAEKCYDYAEKILDKYAPNDNALNLVQNKSYKYTDYYYYKAQIFLAKGNICRKERGYDYFHKAKKFLDDALTCFIKIESESSEAVIFYEIGKLYAGLDNYEKALKERLPVKKDSHAKALKNYEHAMTICQKYSKYYAMISIFNAIGNLYEKEHYIDKATTNYGEALKISIKYSFYKSQVITLDVISKLYIQFASNLNYYETLQVSNGFEGQALYPLYRQFLAPFLVNWLTLKELTSKILNEALKYYKMALKISQDNNLPSYEAMVLSKLGKTCEKLGDNKEALSYYDQSSKINKNFHNHFYEKQIKKNNERILSKIKKDRLPVNTELETRVLWEADNDKHERDALKAYSRKKRLAKLKKKAGEVTNFQLREIAIEYWLNYDEIALNNILELRLRSTIYDTNVKDSIRVTDAKIINFSEYYNTLSKNLLIYLIKEIYSIYINENNIQIILIPILIPKSVLLYHWVGIALAKQNYKMTITYLDSENQSVIKGLEANFISQLQELFVGYQILFTQISVEQQRYNNCGPELVENFMYYLIGTRANQEAAPYLHSLLYENSLLDPEFSAPQIVENNRLIAELSNQMRPIYYMPCGYTAREFLFISEILFKAEGLEIKTLLNNIFDQEVIESNIPQTAFTESDENSAVSIIGSSYNANTQSKKPNLALAETMLNIRNGIEFIPVFSYFIKNIVYSISKDALPIELATLNLPEIHSGLLYAGHIGVSYVGALALNIASPSESALSTSSSYGTRLVFKEVVHNIASFDLSNNINMAGYCMANTALHFTPELMLLYYFMNIAQFNYGGEIIGNLLKANTLTVIQRLTTSSLECYNTYKQVHHIEENIETKIEKIIPYISDAITLGSSIAVSYNPFFIIGNIVAVDISSKVILKAIPIEIKASIDLGLTCLGLTSDISTSFTNMYDIYWKGAENEHSLRTYQSCKTLTDSFIQFNWLNKIYDFASDCSYYSDKVIKIIEVKKDQEAEENYNALLQEFGEQKAEYIFKYINKSGLDIKYELLKQAALGVLTEAEYQDKLQKINFAIDIEDTHYNFCISLSSNFDEGNNTLNYNCYSKANDAIDRIITDGAKLIGLYNLYSE